MRKTYSGLSLFVMVFAVFLAFCGGRFFSPPGIQAQSSDVAEKSLEEKVELFFRKLNQPGTQFSSAFEELFRDGAVSSRATSDAVESISKKYQELNTFEIGQYHSLEKIGAEKIGQDVLLLKYISKHDNTPVAWTFVFYHPPRSGSSTVQTGSQWKTIFVRFDTDFEAFSQYGVSWKP